MKHLRLFTTSIMILCSCLAVSVSGQAFDSCEVVDCTTDTLNISSGWDHGTDALEPIGNSCDNWELVSVPGSSGINLPSPSYVITPHSAWATLPNARWVSPFISNLYGTNNPDTPFVFQNCICLCQDAFVRIVLDLNADDSGAVLIDGNLLAAGASYASAWTIHVDTTIALNAGQHCFTVEMFNLGSGAMGFTLEGEVIGVNLLTSSCCRPTGRICGNKFLDTDCNGSVTVNDPVLSGWQIELRDAANTVIATTTTDALGNYCFTNLPAGNYTVSEINQAGYTQSFPPVPGTHAITLTGNNSELAHFGNCQDPTPPCDFDLSFDYTEDRCRFDFTSMIMNIPSGYTVASTIWKFGDGTSSTELNPIHFYEYPGFFNVCLTVTIFNGVECCTRTFCQEIFVHEPCEGDCEIDAKVTYNVNDDCAYDFGVQLNYSGLPINTVFWDFGDGTTGNGWNVNHRFACNGVYNVCVTLFAINGDQCCFRKFCVRVNVTCMCCDGDGNADDGGDGTGDDGTVPAGSPSPDSPSGGIKDKGANLDLKALKLYPNPNDGGFNLVFNLPERSSVKVAITDMKGKKVYEKEMGIMMPGEQNIHTDANLPPGVYVCEIVAAGSNYRSNLVINK